MIPIGIQISDINVTFLHEFLLKFHALISVFKIGNLVKKFPERAILLKKCAKNRKYSRTGHFVKKSFGIVKFYKATINLKIAH